MNELASAIGSNVSGALHEDIGTGDWTAQLIAADDNAAGMAAWRPIWPVPLWRATATDRRPGTPAIYRRGQPPVTHPPPPLWPGTLTGWHAAWPW